MEKSVYIKKKKEAEDIYNRQSKIYSPFFKENIVLNSDGFHHLRYSARKERKKEEQVLKFILLPKGLHILKKATTVQEYRKILMPIGKRSKRDGSIQMKYVEWWGFIAIFMESKNKTKVRVVLRRIGQGNVHFWSVMPHSKIRNDRTQKLFTQGLEDD